MKRSGLGRGLDVLLPQNDELFQTVVQEIAIDDIDPNTAQPRKDFDKEALEQLAESIRSAGVLSPILVVQDGCITEQGDHETLLAQQGSYARLYHTQNLGDYHYEAGTN